MIGVVARASLTRLARERRAWVAPLAWVALAIFAALVTRARGAVHGADDLLPGTLGPFVVPLLAYAAVGAVLGPGGLRSTMRGYVAVGAPPRAAAFGPSFVAIGLASASGALATGLGALLAHGPSDPSLALDLPISTAVGALGGAAYGALFSAGAAVGAGALRGMLLAADFVLGGGGGPLGVLFPRGHLLALLGSESAIAENLLPRRASSVALVVLGALYLLVVVRASRRRP